MPTLDCSATPISILANILSVRYDGWLLKVRGYISRRSSKASYSGVVALCICHTRCPSSLHPALSELASTLALECASVLLY